jgi:hypothetical protein
MSDIEKLLARIGTARDAISRKDEQTSLDYMIDGVLMNCYVMLKEQEAEAVKPHYNARTNWYECGVCKYSMTSGMHCRNEVVPAFKVGFCAKCGHAVKWNE